VSDTPPATPAPGDVGRRSNLALVLSLLHRKGALSRAELTRATGLNRSTIATLTGQLAELRLAYEAAPSGASQIGRPSPMVHADPATAALVLNPEIDAITLGLVGLGGVVLKRVRYETDRVPSAREVANVSAAIIEGMRPELDATYRVTGIGVAVPGLTRADDGMVTYAPHLEWFDEPIADMLHEATGYRVRASNDATLGAAAEILFGAGRGASDVIYLNGGASGIGGGIVTQGSPLTGTAGYAGELGHTLVNSSGRLCHCGAHGCLETEVSRAPLLSALGLSSRDSDRLEEDLVAAFAAEPGPGPALAGEVARQARYLAIALRNAVNLVNPSLIVLGGFLGSLYRVAPERIEAAVRGEAMRGAREGVRIVRAELGRDSLLIGAAELAFSDLLANPREAETLPRRA